MSNCLKAFSLFLIVLLPANALAFEVKELTGTLFQERVSDLGTFRDQMRGAEIYIDGPNPTYDVYALSDALFRMWSTSDDVDTVRVFRKILQELPEDKRNMEGFRIYIRSLFQGRSSSISGPNGARRFVTASVFEEMARSGRIVFTNSFHHSHPYRDVAFTEASDESPRTVAQPQPQRSDEVAQLRQQLTALRRSVASLQSQTPSLPEGALSSIEGSRLGRLGQVASSTNEDLQAVQAEIGLINEQLIAQSNLFSAQRDQVSAMESRMNDILDRAEQIEVQQAGLPANELAGLLQRLDALESTLANMDSTEIGAVSFAFAVDSARAGDWQPMADHLEVNGLYYAVALSAVTMLLILFSVSLRFNALGARVKEIGNFMHTGHSALRQRADDMDFKIGEQYASIQGVKNQIGDLNARFGVLETSVADGKLSDTSMDKLSQVLDDVNTGILREFTFMMEGETVKVRVVGEPGKGDSFRLRFTGAGDLSVLDASKVGDGFKVTPKQLAKALVKARCPGRQQLGKVA